MAFVLAVVFGLVAVICSIKDKKVLGIVASFIAAISLIIAAPQMLHPTFMSLNKTGTYVVGLIGIILVLLGFVWKKGAVLVVLGTIVIVWCSCRLIPTLPPAFDHLAPTLGKAGKIFWNGLVTFFKEASGSK